MPVLHANADVEPPTDPAGPGEALESPPSRGGWQGPVRGLDPRRIPLDRTVNTIVNAGISMTHLVACAVLWLTGVWSSWVVGLAALAWPPVFALLAWHAIWWPAIDFRHWRYRVSDEGIEIWSGVAWRRAVAVPRSRVQHIDVSQGPFERSYGLATLSIYTAGTQYSKVDLPGLDHGVALGLRDSLLPNDAERAV